MSQQEITNDELARMIKEGFDAVDKRFEAVDKRFDRIELRLDRVEERLDKVEVRLDKIDGRLDRIELMAFGDYKRRVERLEDQVKELMMAGR